MNANFEETLDEIEKLTDSILQASVGADFVGEEILSCLRERASLIKRLSEELQSKPPLDYTTYNRLIILHVQGEQMGANLQRIRSGIVSQMSATARHRMFAERLAGQLLER